MIKQEGTHFLSLDRADWMVTSAGIRTYFHLLFIFFHLLTLSVYHALTVFVRRASVSVSTHFHTHKEKGNKVLVELWVFPWSEYKALWFVSAHVLLPLQAQRANCAQQHPSVIQSLTNALAIVVFDGDTNTHRSPGAALNTPQLLWCRYGRLVVGARLFWWWSVSWQVHMLFWSLLSEPSELTQTQLARVEPTGVHRELKDMDLCQHILYIVHILQVQLRIRDSGPSPLTAQPTICPPGAGGSVA